MGFWEWLIVGIIIAVVSWLSDMDKEGRQTMLIIFLEVLGIGAVLFAILRIF